MLPRLAIVLVIFCICGAQLACVGEPKSPAREIQDNLAQLRWLDHADVDADFRQHVERDHDTRFLSVYGFDITTAFPGLDDSPEIRRLIKKHGERHIKGTSDLVPAGEYDRLLQKADDYAKRYNTMLLRYLRHDNRGRSFSHEGNSVSEISGTRN